VQEDAPGAAAHGHAAPARRAGEGRADAGLVPRPAPFREGVRHAVRTVRQAAPYLLGDRRLLRRGDRRCVTGVCRVQAEAIRTETSPMPAKRASRRWPGRAW